MNAAGKKTNARVSSIGDETGPLVSVVIRNYNYSQFLRDAVDSAIAQTYRRLEIIVVDDGSDDDSREILIEYGNSCRVLLQSNLGETRALNNGFAIVAGDLVLFLDADDVLAPDAIASVVAAWAPDVTRISYPMQIMTENGHLLRACRPPGYDMNLTIEQQFARFGEAMSACQSANAYATAALLDVMPIEPSAWPFPPDCYLNALTSVMGRVVLLADPHGGYRMHRRNFTLLNTLDGRKCAAIAATHVRLHETVRDFVGDARWEDFAPILPTFHWLHRLLSLRMAPQLHPFARDRRGKTLLRALGAICRSGSAGWGRKLTLFAGAMMIVLLPQGLLRRALPGMLLAARAARYRGLFLQRWSRGRHWRQIYRMPR